MRFCVLSGQARDVDERGEEACTEGASAVFWDA